MCEDYPCCGHTRLDPCPGQAVVMTNAEALEHYWCDDCGFSHFSPCHEEYEEEDDDDDLA